MEAEVDLVSDLCCDFDSFVVLRLFLVFKVFAFFIVLT
jgi:hypothetical protein